MSDRDYSKRVLVVRLSALGDVAILEPVLRQRASENPDVLFLLAAPPRLEPLFRGMDNVQYIPTEKRQNPRELYGILSALKPDMVADMHHVLRTIGMDWLFRLHGVPVYGIRKHDRRGIASWQRYDRVFEHCGLKGSVSLGDYWQVKPSDGRPRVVGVAPFAQHQGKVWPLGKMERLVAMLSERGYRVWLFGSASEASLLDSWAEKYERVESLAGKYGFAEELERIETLDGEHGLCQHALCFLQGGASCQHLGGYASLSRFLWLEAGPHMGGSEGNGLQTLLQIW